MALTAEQVAQFMASLKESQAKISDRSGPRVERPADGENRYRILPNWNSKSPFDVNVWVKYARHWVKGLPEAPGARSNISAVTLCNKTTYGQKCPVCEAYWGVKNLEPPAQIDEILKQSNASTKFIVNALHRNSVTPNKVIQLELPFGIAKELFGDGEGSMGRLWNWMMTSKRGSPYDLELGTDIIIKRTGQGVFVKYSIDIPIDDSPAIDPSVLNDLKDLDALVNQWKHSPEDEMKAIATLREIAAAVVSGAGVAPAQASQWVMSPVPVTPSAPPPAQPPADLAAQIAKLQAQMAAQATQVTEHPATIDPATKQDVTGDVFKPVEAVAPPVGTVTNIDMSMEDITKLLAASGLALPAAA